MAHSFMHGTSLTDGGLIRRLNAALPDKAVWQRNLLNTIVLASVLLYVLIYVNIPVAVLAGAMHDDGLFIAHGFSIAAGDWLGPYSQYTLMKGSGYPLFLAALSAFRFPVPLAQALLFAGATWLFAMVAQRLFRSLLITLMTFEFVLWNFGPETDRITRDAIYHSQFVICFALMALAFFASGRRRISLMAASGLCLGWMWITREEGIANLPAILIVAAYFGIAAKVRARGYRPLLPVFAVFIFAAAMLPSLVAYRNYRRYQEFETVDIKGEFAGALSALESIDQVHERPFLAIPREVREKAYRVSPTFARLKKVFDDPGLPQIVAWKDPGCGLLPTTCGDYAVGWFMWGLRDAAAVEGQYINAHTSEQFFHAIRIEIQQACRDGRLTCHSSPVPFMPHLTAEELQAFPKAYWTLTRDLLFLNLPASAPSPSVGTPEQVRDAALATNVTNYLMPSGTPIPMENARAARVAIRLKHGAIRVYSYVIPIMLPLGFTAFLVCAGMCMRRRILPFALALIFACWTEIVLRLAILALIDVTAFPATFNLYVSLAFPLSCFASLAGFFLVRQLLIEKAPERPSLPPKALRGVGGQELHMVGKEG